MSSFSPILPFARRRPTRHPNPSAAGQRKWTDDQIVEALYRMDHLGHSAKEVGASYGVSRNCILSLRRRFFTDPGRNDNGVGDGTMDPTWALLAPTGSRKGVSHE